MCEINPAHTLVFRLEAFTSDKAMSEEEFNNLVCAKVLDMEMKLNEDGRFRFHIHENFDKSIIDIK